MPTFEYTAQADLTVALHDADGKRLGRAKFHMGVWTTDDPALAAAMDRALPGLKQYGAAGRQAPVSPVEELTLTAAAQDAKADDKPATKKKEH